MPFTGGSDAGVEVQAVVGGGRRFFQAFAQEQIDHPARRWGSRAPRGWTLELAVPPDPALLGIAFFAQWTVFYRRWLSPQPPRPMLLTEEGLRWSDGGMAVIGA